MRAPHTRWFHNPLHDRNGASIWTRVAVAWNGSKEDGRTDGPLEPYALDLLGLVPDRFLSLSSRVIGERERRRGRPWEARAICIPNDRMTFARCIKMPLIDGARENTFADLVSRCCSIKRSRPPLLLSDHLEDINSLTEGTKRGETEQKEPRPRVKFDQMAPNSILPSIFHFQLMWFSIRWSSMLNDQIS